MLGLWLHDASEVIFTLTVDDLGVKCIGRCNTMHLINTLKDKHEDAKVNWDSGKLCSINLC